MIYCDHAATGPIHPVALAVLKDSLEKDFGNSSSAHSLGRELSKKLDNLRLQFIKTLHAKEGQVLFTSGATESNNLAIRGFSFQKGDRVLVSSADHPSLVLPFIHLAELNLIELFEIPLDSTGRIMEDAFFALVLKEKISYVALTHVNSQSGVIHPIERISQKIKKMNKNICIHVDAAQSFLKFDIDVSFIDSLSVSAHKCGGPKGIGALYIKNCEALAPINFGGGQEFNKRSGTVAFPLINSFGAVLKIWEEERESNLLKVKKMNEIFCQHLRDEKIDFIMPFKKGDETDSPYILTIIIPDISSDIILRHLEMEQIFISSTTACSSKIKGDNPVFFALNIKKNWHKNVLRISFSPSNTEEEMKMLGQVLANTCKELQFLIKK